MTYRTRRCLLACVSCPVNRRIANGPEILSGGTLSLRTLQKITKTTAAQTSPKYNESIWDGFRVKVSPAGIAET